MVRSPEGAAEPVGDFELRDLHAGTFGNLRFPRQRAVSKKLRLHVTEKRVPSHLLRLGSEETSSNTTARNNWTHCIKEVQTELIALNDIKLLWGARVR